MKKTKKKTKAKSVKKTAKKSCKRGFTLIELLVVVAIIGILAGIVVISTTSARNRAIRASVISTMSSIVTTAAVCVHEDGTVDVTPAVGDAICSDLADIDETWPTLPTEVTNAGYTYANMTADNTNITITDGTNTCTCTIATSNCSW